MPHVLFTSGLTDWALRVGLDHAAEVGERLLLEAPPPVGGVPEGAEGGVCSHLYMYYAFLKYSRLILALTRF